MITVPTWQRRSGISWLEEGCIERGFLDYRNNFKIVSESENQSHMTDKHFSSGYLQFIFVCF